MHIQPFLDIEPPRDAGHGIDTERTAQGSETAVRTPRSSYIKAQQLVLINMTSQRYGL